VLAGLDGIEWWQDEEVLEAVQEPLLRGAAYYFLAVRNKRGTPRDSVARFHLGNGARLERINWLADTSAKGIRQSLGIMVNYLYDLDEIEKNHEAYAETRTVVASNQVRRLARSVIELAPAPVAG
jgi:malonyl-CoA decarboxylase